MKESVRTFEGGRHNGGSGGSAIVKVVADVLGLGALAEFALVMASTVTV